MLLSLLNSSLIDWVPIISILTNGSVLILAFKVVRHITRIETKTDMMWEFLNTKFGPIPFVERRRRRRTHTRLFKEE